MRRGQADGDEGRVAGGGRQARERAGPRAADGSRELGDVVVGRDADAEGKASGRVGWGQEEGEARAGAGGEAGGVARVVGVDGGEDLARGGRVARQHADRVERVGVGDDAPARDEAVGGLEADDARVGGGEADGAACVGS